jgi:hypothetical protein
MWSSCWNANSPKVTNGETNFMELQGFEVDTSQPKCTASRTLWCVMVPEFHRIWRTRREPRPCCKRACVTCCLLFVACLSDCLRVLVTYPPGHTQLLCLTMKCPPRLLLLWNCNLTVLFEYALHHSVSVLQGPQIFTVIFFCWILYDADSKTVRRQTAG